MTKTYVALGFLGLAGCGNQPESAPVSVAPAAQLRVQPTATPPATSHPVSQPDDLHLKPTTTPSEKDKAIFQEIQAFKSADPLADVEKSWQSGERRLAGIHTMGVEIPGVESQQVAMLIEKPGVKIIAEVGDINVTEAGNELYRVASDYGARYNRRLLAKFAEQGSR
ncbi:hypothetical protein IAD21_04636 [Abditibacteriota bacterium]|nr:hypothetical protein IAD21_04636 [Abditibacteriota bacterium]